MASGNALGSPIPLSELESVLAWVDSFKLSRATKKINRDFSDAVLLAEMLAVHYPKLVEMHNYPPRNSHALKLNNWMTLNRKVLKKLKLNLCVSTMEQLANSTTGVIERVLLMVRDKIKKDEELEKSTKEGETNMSSGGSYYEACGDEDHVLVVPVKTRVNGILETIQQKVVSYDAYMTLKGELKDAIDVAELLKQKVDHLDNLIKLKDERVTELQKQLERKQLRRKDPEIIPNCLSVPFDEFPSPATEIASMATTNKFSTVVNAPEMRDTIHKEALKVPTPKVSHIIIKPQVNLEPDTQEGAQEKTNIAFDPALISAEPSISEVTIKDKIKIDLLSDVERIKSDVFKEANVFEDKTADGDEEFKDSEPGNIVTIEDTIKNEVNNISNLTNQHITRK